MQRLCVAFIHSASSSRANICMWDGDGDGDGGTTHRLTQCLF